ncbi:hypothetical protein [Amycolatopsis albispora]|uniref:Uncharacterized protein n=1 Tax=Amycolatopsis albispora TaxID=1804986 RepID=A0A344LGY8_9PSEU|nr:hypothetical protein [Amycolatopsis albispora]AXB47312.1 hypothetical protein A4R43_36705 [Amycolatopsis albispora]
MGSNRNRNRKRRTEAAQRPPEGKTVRKLGIVLDRPDAELNLEREPLFTAGGITYDIPVTAPAGWQAIFALVVKDEGVDAAVAWAMKRMLGEKGLAALRDSLMFDEDLVLISAEVIKRLRPGVAADPKDQPSKPGQQ